MSGHYPEHDKLSAIMEVSQEIGLFLDHGLPRQHLVLAQWGDDEVLYPSHRSIDKILAEYFGIDRDRLDDEKRAMLAAMRDAA